MTTKLSQTEKRYSRYLGNLYYDMRWGRLVIVENVKKNEYSNMYYVHYTILDRAEQKTKNKPAIDFERDIKSSIILEVNSEEQYNTFRNQFNNGNRILK
jgi:hypothetical protein